MARRSKMETSPSASPLQQDVLQGEWEDAFSKLTRTPSELQKINISAYRVLFILSLLVQHQSLGMVELNQFLQENELIRRSYNNETITKYINTLRKVGCRIPKTTSRSDYRYVLEENPFPVILQEEELAVVYKALQAVSEASDESLQRRYALFLEQVAWMLPASQRQALLREIRAIQPELPTKERRKDIERYRQYCRDALALEISYQPDSLTYATMCVEPVRILQESSKTYLIAVERAHSSQVKLNVAAIASVRQLPEKVDTSSKQTHVVFQLYDRLAKAYRPYPGESIIFAQGDMIQVRAKTDNMTGLMSRLLKYGMLCQVISPVSMRQMMRERIQHMLRASSISLPTA